MKGSNALTDLLANLLDRANQIEVTKGAKCWTLDSPHLPLKVGVTVVRARLTALLDGEKED